MTFKFKRHTFCNLFTQSFIDDTFQLANPPLQFCHLLVVNPLLRGRYRIADDPALVHTALPACQAQQGGAEQNKNQFHFDAWKKSM